jgi:hypothetical protein
MARWIKGLSGNPKGRPREGTAIAGLAQSQVERHKLVEKLDGIGAREDEYAKVDVDQQIRAIQLLLAYGYGPPQAELEGGDAVLIQVTYMSKEINLQLTALHPTQLHVTQRANRFNVFCCGCRWGKTVLGMDRLIHAAPAG